MDEYELGDPNDLIEALHRYRVLQIASILRKGPLITAELLWKMSPGRYVAYWMHRYVMEAEMFGVISRWRIATDRARRYIVNCITRNGKELLYMYRVMKILDPEFNPRRKPEEYAWDTQELYVPMVW